MIINDKNISNLIKRTQRKCANQTKKKVQVPPIQEPTEADELFSQMKKLPFQE